MLVKSKPKDKYGTENCQNISSDSHKCKELMFAVNWPDTHNQGHLGYICLWTKGHSTETPDQVVHNPVQAKKQYWWVIASLSLINKTLQNCVQDGEHG